MAAASDSSQDASEVESRRSRPGCGTRMSCINFDQHSHCSSCKGMSCDDSRKGIECTDWPDEVFAKYLNIRKH